MSGWYAGDPFGEMKSGENSTGSLQLQRVIPKHVFVMEYVHVVGEVHKSVGDIS